jgi:hypothetical protein
VVDPGDFVYAEGVSQVSFDRARKYLDSASQATDDLFDANFPAASDDIVRLCDACALLDVNFQPAVGMHLLHVGDFARSDLRVIGRLQLHALIPDTSAANSANVTKLTGLAQRNNVSYLVSIGADHAAFMFNSGGMIAFTPTWTFTVGKDSAHVMGRPIARWIRLSDNLLAARQAQRPRAYEAGDRPHLSSAWIACADGCCTATADQ